MLCAQKLSLVSQQVTEELSSFLRTSLGVLYAGVTIPVLRLVSAIYLVFCVVTYMSLWFSDCTAVTVTAAMSAMGVQWPETHGIKWMGFSPSGISLSVSGA